MSRPSFQFYPDTWKNNAKLRRCSEAARGVWMDILCLLHDSDEYGVCRWPLVDLIRAAAAKPTLVKELIAKDVLKGADKDAPPYIHIPRHAGKNGEPIVLVNANGGPCWYSSRLVRDEWLRQRRGAGTRFDAENQPQSRAPNSTPSGSPTRGVGEDSGDGPSSPSSSPEEIQIPKKSKPKKADAPDVERPDGVMPPAWDDFIRLRESRKSPLTETALARIQKQAGKAGISLQTALEICCARGWTGFEAEWILKDKAGGKAPPAESFYERDLRLKRARNNEMIGRTPSPTSDPNVIDVTPSPMLGINE
ncbi:MAG: hypothetical protein E6Q97_12615 [Desulfurellales bacterium]|nr:MAG: hypothetical protein E6Q97_12615 [Desulfurellales bacterium]